MLFGRSVDGCSGKRACFIAGSAAICALPPLNGFASEWLLYQGFFHLARDGAAVGVRLGGLLLMGWLALVGVSSKPRVMGHRPVAYVLGPMRGEAVITT